MKRALLVERATSRPYVRIIETTSVSKYSIASRPSSRIVQAMSNSDALPAAAGFLWSQIIRAMSSRARWLISPTVPFFFRARVKSRSVERLYLLRIRSIARWPPRERAWRTYPSTRMRSRNTSRLQPFGSRPSAFSVSYISSKKDRTPRTAVLSLSGRSAHSRSSAWWAASRGILRPACLLIFAWARLNARSACRVCAYVSDAIAWLNSTSSANALLRAMATSIWSATRFAACCSAAEPKPVIVRRSRRDACAASAAVSSASATGSRSRVCFRADAAARLFIRSAACVKRSLACFRAKLCPATSASAARSADRNFSRSTSPLPISRLRRSNSSCFALSLSSRDFGTFLPSASLAARAAWWASAWALAAAAAAFFFSSRAAASSTVPRAFFARDTAR